MSTNRQIEKMNQYKITGIVQGVITTWYGYGKNPDDALEDVWIYSIKITKIEYVGSF